MVASSTSSSAALRLARISAAVRATNTDPGGKTRFVGPGGLAYRSKSSSEPSSASTSDATAVPIPSFACTATKSSMISSAATSAGAPSRRR